MTSDRAACDQLGKHLAMLATAFDDYARAEFEDAQVNPEPWHAALDQPLPEQGVGIDTVTQLIPNASPIPKPGCSAFITTGATDAGVLAQLAGAVTSPQRVGLTAFHHLEALSLSWLKQLFGLPDAMQGIYSSGGSVANLIGLGAARQSAFKQLGMDVGATGLTKPCRIYTSSAAHRTVHRASAVLGMGRDAVVPIPVNAEGAMDVQALRDRLQADRALDAVPVAIVATAGTTDAGIIDPIQAIAALASDYGIWLHVDGAYGLPGLLDERVSDRYAGLEKADSVTVDPHKWLGAPVGIGATFVRDVNALTETFSQGVAHYLEGSASENCTHSMASLGVPYGDFGVELSAPPRGAVVWALLKEIGRDGLKQRIVRHNDMARTIAERVRQHPNLELVLEPMLSICCFRYVVDGHPNLDALNRAIHRQLMLNNQNIPSTTVIDDKLVIRPCFVGARADLHHADDLVDEVLAIGSALTNHEEEHS